MKIRGATVATPTARRAVTDDTSVSKAPWSSKHTVETLCPAFTESGSVVACEPVEGYPLQVVSKIIPKQSGSGDPSPENVRPIESWTGAKLWHGGKNIINLNNAVIRDGKTPMPVVDNGVVWKAGNTYFFYIRFDQPMPVGTKVYVSWKSEKDSLGNDVRYCNLLRAGDYTMGGGGCGPGGVLIATEPATGIVLSKQYGDVPLAEDIIISDICVTVDAGQAYEPYRGEEITIDFGQAVYGGSYNWNTGELTVTHKGAAMKDFYWQGVNDKYFISFLTDAAVPNGPGHSGLCSVFPVVTDWTGSSDIYNGKKSVLAVSSMNFSASAQVTVGNPLAQSVDEFTANLDENKAFLVYPLEIPITIQLTPQEVLALPGVNTLYTDTGDTTVSGRADTTAVIEKLTNAIIALGGNV